MKALHSYEKAPCVRITDANAAGFFPSGLEYNTPARGMWNIVHTGMLLPEAQQIFVCAQGCLRGVILTAAEMNALDRMSWVSVSEQDMFDGTLEQKVIDGTADILRRLGKKPRAVLLFLSCIHLFAGCDSEIILRELSGQFPEIDFVDCYMTPTMRQTVSPAAKLAEQLYFPLRPLPKDPKSVGILGNDRPTDAHSELVQIIRNAGCTLRDLTLCHTYDEYLQMADSALYITYTPVTRSAGEKLTQRIGGRHLHLPASFETDTILENYRSLCEALGVVSPDFEENIRQMHAALDAAYDLIGDREIAIDFTAVSRPFELAKLLTEHGFRVRHIIADAAPEETEAFAWLQVHVPDLMLYAATNVNMLHFHEEPHPPVLAIGQKAAYYFATDHFVNIVMNGGFYGFSGIVSLAGLMEDAFRNPKNRRTVLRHKGWGCESCLG